MCFEQQVQVIVMLNNLEDENILETEHYFPKLNQVKKIGGYEIRTQAKMSENGLTYRNIKVQSKKKTQTFIHYQYSNWKDKGIVEEEFFENFANFLQIIFKLSDQKSHEFSNCSLLIHCKAGIGRSGTFLALLFIYEKLKMIY